MSAPNTVVYVDSGLTGGGSFESLRQHLAYSDREAYRPVAVFLNRTEYVAIFQGMGVPVRLVKDSVYDRERLEHSPKLARFMERLALAPHLLIPPLSRAWESTIHRYAIRTLQKILTEECAAILHTNNQVNRDFYAIIAAYRVGVTCVAHLRSFFSFGFNRTKARFANQAVSRFVAYSPAIAKHWVSRGIDEAKMEIVYNGIGELAVSTRDLHSEFNIPENHAIIGAVGKIIPERGYDLLIRAFASLAKNVRGVSLVIIGGGESSRVAELQGLARYLGVGEQVVFAGRRKPAVDFIAAMDVLVLPYTIEPFGRVLLEAWSLGVPTVLTDVGGIRMIAEDGKTALIVPPNHEERLASAILQVITDRRLAERMAEQGRKAVAMRFNIKNYARSMERIYGEVLAEAMG